MTPERVSEARIVAADQELDDDLIAAAVIRELLQDIQPFRGMPTFTEETWRQDTELRRQQRTEKD